MGTAAHTVDTAVPHGDSGHKTGFSGTVSGSVTHTADSISSMAQPENAGSGSFSDAADSAFANLVSDSDGAVSHANSSAENASNTQEFASPETSTIDTSTDAGKYQIPETMLHHTDDMFSSGNSAAISGTVDASVSVDGSGKLGAGRGEAMADYDYVKAGEDRDSVRSIRSELDTHDAHAFTGKMTAAENASGRKPSAENTFGRKPAAEPAGKKTSSDTDGLSREDIDFLNSLYETGRSRRARMSSKGKEERHE